jgi:hypothetical protein
MPMIGSRGDRERNKLYVERFIPKVDAGAYILHREMAGTVQMRINQSNAGKFGIFAYRNRPQPVAGSTPGPSVCKPRFMTPSIPQGGDEIAAAIRARSERWAQFPNGGGPSGTFGTLDSNPTFRAGRPDWYFYWCRITSESLHHPLRFANRPAPLRLSARNQVE